MAISRNIKPDRGLTYRMLMTGFLLVLLYGVVVGILIAIGISYALVLIIAVALDLLPVLVQRQNRHVRHARQGGHARAGA